MVIQRRKRIHIWGWDTPGAKVEALMDGLTSAADTGDDGRFDIYLPAKESGGPYELIVSDDGGEEIRVHDVMVGLVWFCTGQSNMELPIARVRDRYPYLAEIEENSSIRTFKIIEDSDFNGPRDELRSGSWNHVSRDTIMDYSATGYFFAERLHELTGETVGFINASLGGSKISSWMSRDMLEGYDELIATADKYADADFREGVADRNVINALRWREKLDKLDRGLNENWKDPELNDSRWKKMDIPVMFKDTELNGMCGAVWFRRRFDLPAALAGKKARLFLGTMVDRDEVYVNGVKVGGTEYQYPPRKYDIPEGLTRDKDNSVVIRLCVENGAGRITPDKEYRIFNEEASVSLDGTWKYKVAATCDRILPTDFINWKPTGLYHAMTYPCHNYPVDGVLWYQGESDTYEYRDYADLSRRQIKGYRDKWGEENLPYIFVQLPNFVIDVEEPDDPWPLFRVEQSKLLEEPSVGMIVSMDLGEDNDLHPTGKKPIGERLALWAAHMRYGYPGEYTGPVARSFRCFKAVAGVTEDAETESIVEISFDHAMGLHSRDIGKGSAIKDFEVVTKSGGICGAEATVSGDRVLLRVGVDAEEIDSVRYLMSYTYTGAMIYNSAELPMGPFELKVR